MNMVPDTAKAALWAWIAVVLLFITIGSKLLRWFIVWMLNLFYEIFVLHK